MLITVGPPACLVKRSRTPFNVIPKYVMMAVAVPVTVGILATLPNTVTPQPTALYAPNLVMTFQIALLSYIHVPSVVAPIMYFIGAAIRFFSLYLLQNCPLLCSSPISSRCLNISPSISSLCHEPSYVCFYSPQVIFFPV